MLQFNKSPRRTDNSINMDTWKNLNDQSRRLNNIYFDPQYFFVQNDSTGILVTAVQSGTNTNAPERWTIANVNSTSVSVDVGIINIEGDVQAWSKANVSGLASGDNLIYGYAMRDGSGGILMKANVNSTTMPSQSELGNNVFGFAVGTMNTISGDVVQYIHSDFNVQYPKTKPSEAPILYQVVVLREYDDTGTIVPIGSEQTPPLSGGHYYEYTMDWTRAH